MAVPIPMSDGKLVLSPTLSLPREAVTRTFMILAQRGAGKTYTASVFVEELVRAQLPVCAIDPLGVMWGLRANAKGDGPGLPVTIIGGDHGDVPLEESSGPVLAEFVVESGQPCVLDVSLLRKDEQITFMEGFASHLFHLKASRRDPLHLVVDEADGYAPQNTKGLPKGTDQLLRSMEDLVRRGRSRGLGLTLITQRPAVLNKNVLTQADCLVVLRLSSPQDRKQIEEWAKMNASPEQLHELLSSLAKMPVGTAWFWSPGWLDLFARVKIRERRTFDSSATPEAGKRAIVPRSLAPVELEALKARIADTIEHVKENDPEELRKRIAQLEHELRTAQAATSRVEVPVPFVPESVLHATIRLRDRLTLALDDARIIEAAAGDARPIEYLTDAPPVSGEAPTSAHPVPWRAPDPAPPPRKTAPSASPKPSQGKPIGSGEAAILSVLGRFGPMSKIELAVRTLYKHSGGGFGNYLGALRSRDLIVGDATRLHITPAGKALGHHVTLPTGRALVDAWLAKVGGGAPRKALEELASVHPRKLTKDALASRTGYEASGGGFTNALGALRGLGLVKGKRELGLSDELAAAIR